MAPSLEDALSAFTPEQRARVEVRAEELIEEELTLRDLRQAQRLTQERMAKLIWLYSPGHTETRNLCSRRGVFDKPIHDEKISRRI